MNFIKHSSSTDSGSGRFAISRLQFSKNWLVADLESCKHFVKTDFNKKGTSSTGRAADSYTGLGSNPGAGGSTQFLISYHGK